MRDILQGWANNERIGWRIKITSFRMRWRIDARTYLADPQLSVWNNIPFYMFIARDIRRTDAVTPDVTPADFQENANSVFFQQEQKFDNFRILWKRTVNFSRMGSRVKFGQVILTRNMFVEWDENNPSPPGVRPRYGELIFGIVPMVSLPDAVTPEVQPLISAGFRTFFQDP